MSKMEEEKKKKLLQLEEIRKEIQGKDYLRNVLQGIQDRRKYKDDPDIEIEQIIGD